jgi:hypothetical protein
LKNPKKVKFTAMCWDEESKLLFISDELGFVYVANVYMGEKYTLIKELMPGIKIKNIRICSDGGHRTLLCFTDTHIKAFRIKIGQKSADIEGHTACVLKIICLDP